MKYFCLLFLIFTCHAEDVVVGNLGLGSCWYQNKEGLKVSSFNEHESISISSEELSLALLKLVPVENNKEIQSLFLHCGSQGASFVARIKAENNNICLWAMLDHGKLKTRTIGGIQDGQKGEAKLCDGFKQGELLAVIKNHDYYNQLLSDDKWNSIIKEVVPVAFNFYKIKLVPEYLLREDEVAHLLQDSFGQSVSIEFNQYQHGIGEYVPLK